MSIGTNRVSLTCSIEFPVAFDGALDWSFARLIPYSIHSTALLGLRWTALPEPVSRSESINTTQAIQQQNGQCDGIPRRTWRTRGKEFRVCALR